MRGIGLDNLAEHKQQGNTHILQLYPGTGRMFPASALVAWPLNYPLRLVTRVFYSAFLALPQKITCAEKIVDLPLTGGRHTATKQGCSLEILLRQENEVSLPLPITIGWQNRHLTNSTILYYLGRLISKVYSGAQLSIIS